MSIIPCIVQRKRGETGCALNRFLLSNKSNAEWRMRNANFNQEIYDDIGNLVEIHEKFPVGLADVRQFGLIWDDCYEYLHKLGYDIKVELLEVK